MGLVNASTTTPVAPATLDVTWTVRNRTKSRADGVLQATIDSRPIPSVSDKIISITSGGESTGTTTLFYLSPGKHTLKAQFRRYSGGSHFEPVGPGGITKVENSELVAETSLDIVVIAPAQPVLVCNGSPDLCDRKYDEVAYPTTHNAFQSADQFWINPTQQHIIRTQLDDGIRALMLDAHLKNGIAYLCHTDVCADRDAPYSNPTFEWGLTQVRDFLVANPNEVVTIFIESYVSADDIEASFARSGLLTMVYTYGQRSASEPNLPQVTGWPTLREMINANQRVVVLVDNDLGGTKYPWQHYERKFAWQTGYNYQTSQGDIATDCAVDRGNPSGMFGMNHFLQSPFLAGYDEVNKFDFMWQRVQKCQQERHHMVNFLTVNHYATSAVMQVVALINQSH